MVSICCDKNNKLWFANNWSGDIYKVNADTGETELTLTSPAGEQPGIPCCDLDNNIWFPMYQAPCKLLKITNDVPALITPPTGDYAYSCCVDKNNAVYVSTVGNSLIHKFVNSVKVGTGISVGGFGRGMSLTKDNLLAISVSDTKYLRYIDIATWTMTAKGCVLTTVGNEMCSAGDMTGMTPVLLFGWPESQIPPPQITFFM